MIFNKRKKTFAEWGPESPGVWRVRRPRLSRAAWALLAVATLPGVASAAEVSVTVNAVEELVVEGVNDLNFGAMLIGSGMHQVDKVDPGAGLFTITGTSNRFVEVTLSPPLVLTNANGDEMPYTSGAAYKNQGTADNSPAGSTEFVGNTAIFTIDAANPAPPTQATAYVWIYGEIDVGSLPAGNYTAVFTLTAEYFAGDGPPGGGPPGGGPP